MNAEIDNIDEYLLSGFDTGDIYPVAYTLVTESDVRDGGLNYDIEITHDCPTENARFVISANQAPHSDSANRFFSNRHHEGWIIFGVD